jgi:hypothetical protein
MASTGDIPRSFFHCAERPFSLNSGTKVEQAAKRLTVSTSSIRGFCNRLTAHAQR